jgi:hypothetical protein
MNLSMSQLRLNFYMIVMTIILFLLALAVNELLFTRLEFAPGINWIYLPAGVRLLCTLLFAEAGAVGLLLVSWFVCFCYFFPNDPIRSFMGGILAAAAPYLVYLGMQRHFGLRATLTNLTPRRLLLCAAAFSIASPLLHHVWFALHDHPPHLLNGFVAMSAGDFLGTITVLYAARWILLRMAPREMVQKL